MTAIPLRVLREVEAAMLGVQNTAYSGTSGQREAAINRLAVATGALSHYIDQIAADVAVRVEAE